MPILDLHSQILTIRADYLLSSLEGSSLKSFQERLRKRNCYSKKCLIKMMCPEAQVIFIPEKILLIFD